MSSASNFTWNLTDLEMFWSRSRDVNLIDIYLKTKLNVVFIVPVAYCYASMLFSKWTSKFKYFTHYHTRMCIHIAALLLAKLPWHPAQYLFGTILVYTSTSFQVMTCCHVAFLLTNLEIRQFFWFGGRLRVKKDFVQSATTYLAFCFMLVLKREMITVQSYFLTMDFPILDVILHLLLWLLLVFYLLCRATGMHQPNYRTHNIITHYIVNAFFHLFITSISTSFLFFWKLCNESDLSYFNANESFIRTRLAYAPFIWVLSVHFCNKKWVRKMVDRTPSTNYRVSYINM